MGARAARAEGGARLRRTAALLLGLLLLCGGGVLAQGIGYTVQVLAVSDQDGALEIARSLQRDGFPTYVERATGGQGVVYRVRIGAFANRAAALRYAEAMPDVAGSRPVPALSESIAESISASVMPLAARVVWQGSVELGAQDLRVLPWPQGLALRWQDPAGEQQATYLLVQGNEVRSLQAWWLAPLAELPASPGVLVTDVPFVDLTQRGAGETPAAEQEQDGPAEEQPGNEEPSETEERPESEERPETEEQPGPEQTPGTEQEPGTEEGPGDGEPPGEGETAEAGEDRQSEESPSDEPPTEEPSTDAADDPATEEGAGEAAEGGPATDDGQPEEGGPVLAAADGAAEVGLLLLRDRPLWPPTWEQDGEEVRSAFRRSTIALVASRVGLPVIEVEPHVYRPGGALPPTLVVVEVSDRSGRDVGDIRGLADPRTLADGLRPVSGTSALWWPPQERGEPVPMTPPAAGQSLGGEDWTVTADGGFVRIVMAEGANWRAVAGQPLWSDGRYLLVLDGSDLVLVDFLGR